MVEGVHFIATILYQGDKAEFFTEDPALAKTQVAWASARRLRFGKCEMLAEVTVAGALTTRLRAGQGEMLAEATVAGVSATGLRARQGRNAG